MSRNNVVAFLLVFICHTIDAHEVGEPQLDSTNPARDAERRVMLHRSSIKSGILEVNSNYTRRGQTKDTNYTLIFDGKTTRITMTEAYQGEWMNGEKYSTSHVFTDDDRVLRYCDKKLPDGGDIVASIRPRTSDMQMYYVDPRLIGVIPSSFADLTHYHLNSVFGTVDWKITHAEAATLRDTACFYLRYVRTEGDAAAEFWIDLNRDANVLRAVLTAPKNTIIESIECELAMVDDFGWFPSEVAYRRVESGQTVVEEDLTIRQVQLNMEVSPFLFSLPGIGVPEGWSVFDHTTSPSKEYRLRNGRLVSVSTELQPHVPQRSSEVRWHILMLGVALAAGAVVLVWRNRYVKMRHDE